MERRRGISKEEWLRAQHWLDDTERSLAAGDVMPINASAADQFEIMASNKNYRKIGRADLLIACIALAHRATLVTRNIREFKVVTGLTIENWAD